jgi:acyl-CoA reductase-like NAD-dependent aldehyde dehydrogenase
MLKEKDMINPAHECDGTGLTGCTFIRDPIKARHVAATPRIGEIQINGVSYDIDLAQGGIGQGGIECSGTGRSGTGRSGTGRLGTGHDCSALTLRDYRVVKPATGAVQHFNFEGRNV